MANAARCEELALRFEEAQGRFPLPSAHQQGYEGPACDVLSFATEAIREAFKANPDYFVVDRFIEVKARSTRDGKVILAGNEYTAAHANHERYYVYVIFETEEPDEFEVYEARDPLKLEPVLAHLFDIVRAPKGAVQLYCVSEDEVEESAEAQVNPPIPFDPQA